MQPTILKEIQQGKKNILKFLHTGNQQVRACPMCPTMELNFLNFQLCMNLKEQIKFFYIKKKRTE